MRKTLLGIIGLLILILPLSAQCVIQKGSTVTLMMGPAVDATDGVTAETALSPTVYLSKNGGTQAARNDATAITHDRDGYYKVVLNTTDTNTAGNLLAQFSNSGTHAPVWQRCQVQEVQSYALNILGQSPTLADLQQLTGVLRQNTAQAGAASTITLDASANATDNYYQHSEINIVSGTGAGQVATIESYVGSTKVATIKSANAGGNWITNPDSTSVFVIKGSTLGATGAGAIGSASFAAGAIDATALASGAITSAKFASGAITSTVLANDAITAANLSSDANSEIANGLLDLPNGIETSYTLRAAMRLMLSTQAGKQFNSGSQATFRDVNDTKNRVTATVSSSGRSSVTLDPN